MFEIRGSQCVRALLIVFALCTTLTIMTPLRAADQTDLAKKTQNPVSDLISLPLQYNVTYDVGPEDAPLRTLNIQPVIPVSIGSWNLINRPILPVIDQPPLAQGTSNASGLGDLNYQLFFSPAAATGLIWGVGTALQVPTATDDLLGTGKWSIGPSFVALAMPARWVIGGVVQQVWSFAGDDDRAGVSRSLLQYFVNYNFDHGWYVSSAPIITADWNAPSGQRWVVPFGGGFGKITRFGRQPVNLQMQIFYNAEHPDTLGDYSVRLQLQLLFPKKPAS